MPNIVEKYIEMKGQFIILISGLPGCGKQELGQAFERDLKFKLLDTYNYYKKDYNKKITLGENQEFEIINLYTDDAIDWNKLNEDIDKYKQNGVVVIGMSLPQNKIDNVDYHFHLNISKQVSMEKLKEYVTLNKDKFPEDFENIGTPLEKLKMNKLIYPYYLETTKLSKINKYISVKEMNHSEIYDVAFDVLMQFIQKYLDDINKLKASTTANTTTIPNSKKPQNLDIQLELLEQPKYSYDDEIDMMKKYGDDNSSDSDNSDSEDTSTE